MTIEELKPCPNPWCTEPFSALALHHPGFRLNWAMVCRCGFKGPHAETREEARSRWNVRPVSFTASPSREWLEKMAATEADGEVSVGGLACDVGFPVTASECDAGLDAEPAPATKSWEDEALLTTADDVSNELRAQYVPGTQVGLADLVDRLTARLRSALAEVQRLTANLDAACTALDTTKARWVEARAATELRESLTQLHMQLAGCLVAAEGNATGSNDCHRGDYGWSLAFETVWVLRRAFILAVGIASTTPVWEDKNPLDLAAFLIREAEAERVAARKAPGDVPVKVEP